MVHDSAAIPPHTMPARPGEQCAGRDQERAGIAPKAPRRPTGVAEQPPGRHS
ncbi:hypothetical protein LN042_14910 [Kitasatospora sp. RB6PN24]|uniref:hypothetical protein n=1 Tax=Kitasatospora humi TaxID=2893891 RepID=UPI001E35BDB6|nr:hypothetical protein [Kitasatospora humi]MCC9308364.1 hypothetical protein [Kitasatospora humi]